MEFLPVHFFRLTARGPETLQTESEKAPWPSAGTQVPQNATLGAIPSTFLWLEPESASGRRTWLQESQDAGWEAAPPPGAFQAGTYPLGSPGSLQLHAWAFVEGR